MADTERHLVTFRVGGQLYGVDIMQVHRVLLAEDVRDVPGSPPHVVGMIDLHGKLVAVVSLAELLGHDPTVESRRLVVVRRASEMVALAVEEVEGRVRIDLAQVLARPEGIMAEALVGAFHKGEEMGLTLDPDLLEVELEA
jgi:purine-binding chemotaxis protein CheW